MELPETKSWRAGLSMDFDILIGARQGGVPHYLIVRFTGDYMVPGARREGGSFMAMVVAAALAHERGPGVGLVVDLQDLNYTGGDRFLYWKTLLPNFGLNATNYNLALACSEHNRTYVESLLQEE